ncbi:MAG: FtsX-like permease family protein, partial [Algicola sp.]|nr:FtsX-like permease family protein [Algicola sp.]
NIQSSRQPAISSPDLGYDRVVNLTGTMPRGEPLTAEMLGQAFVGEFPRLDNLTVESMEERWLEQTLTQRVSLWIILTMTALTILLAAIGVAGLTQMTTFHRKYELAIRMATGAKQIKLLQFVLKDALWMLLIGLGLGFVISVIGYMQLIQVIDLLPPFNWLTITTLDIGLVVVVLMSVILPAWKVIRNDPMQALREE